MYLYPHNYAEIVAAIACTICLINKPSVTNKWFIGFLWLTVFIELTGKLLIHYPQAKNCMYNLFGIIECTFYLLYFAAVSNNRNRIFKILAVTLVILSTVDFLFLNT